MMRLVPTVAALGAALALAGCSGSGGSSEPTAKGASATGSVSVQTVTETVQAPAANGGSGGAGDGTFGHIPSIVSNVAPSVVAILVQGSQGAGEGSGVIWSADGKIVTNNHVVEGASRMEVVFADGTRAPAKLVATDRYTDLAVVSVSKPNLPPARFAPALPAVGSLAVAIGSPLGFQNSVTAGIISGLHRSLPGGQGEGPAITELMQTDAAISPGNSGGALVDVAGRVVGINDAYIPPNAGAVAIGFAIPSTIVSPTVRQLIATGKVEHAFLGIQPADITPELAERFGLKARQGVLVYDVVRGSPAASAGIEPGDVITRLDGRTLKAVEDLLSTLQQHRPGETVTLTLVRGGETRQVRATLANRPG